MQRLLHIHFSFLCRSKRSNEKGQSPIVLRIIYRHERRDVYTGLYCSKDDWNAEADQVIAMTSRHPPSIKTLN
jgi:Arm DNA-binding domain